LFWKNHFEQNGYEVIATPEVWDDAKDFTQQLTDLYRDFYVAIDKCDAFFLANEDKNGITGYIGANGTAELIYATMQNIVHGKNIDIYIAKIPDESVLAHDEVTSFIKTGWIKVYNQTS
jgi:hypothetical protein